MPVFYFHRQNTLATKLIEMTGEKSFLYQSRGELEMKLQRLIGEAGYDLWPTFHTVMGGIASGIDLKFELDPEDPIDNHAIKLCKKDAPWYFVKIHNGPKMSCVVGYSSSCGQGPFNMSNTQMAQAGIIRTSVVPR